MKAFINHIISVNVFLACMFIAYTGKSQKPEVLDIQFKDSVQVLKEARFADNNITVVNPSDTTITFTFSFEAPSGWRGMAIQQELKLMPGEKQIIPFSLVSLPGALAEWATVQLLFRSAGGSVLAQKQFLIKPQAVCKFMASPVSKFIRLPENEKQLLIKVYLVNTGNVTSNIQLNIRNYVMELDRLSTISLPPQKDSIVAVLIKLSDQTAKNIIKENISVRATDTAGNAFQLPIVVERLVNVLKKNASAYNTVPVEVENGYMLMDNELSYYGGIRGRFSMSEKSAVTFSYRTKEYGMENQLQANVFTLGYQNERLNLFIGQQNEARHFISFGTGARLAWKNKMITYNLGGSFHNRTSFYKSDNIEAGISLEKKKLKTQQIVAANFDQTTKSRSVLTINKTALIHKANMTLDVNAGIGLEKFQYKNAFTRPGGSLGYSFRYMPKNFVISSSLQYNGNRLPGVNKGLRMQNHTLSWNVKTVYLNIFYQANRNLINLFRDTVYNTDALKFNAARYGILNSYQLKHATIGLGFGKFSQVGISGNTLNNYNYFETNLSFNPNKNLSVRLNAFNGVGYLDDAKTKRLWISNSSGGIYYKSLSLSGLYVAMPLIVEDSGANRFLRYEQTLNITPALSLTLFKALYLNLNYSIAKSLYDNRVTSFTGFRLGYLGRQNGWSVNVNGAVPIVKSNAQTIGLGREYVSLGIQKKLNLPILVKRKYVDIRISPFEDLNGNGIKEKEERLLKDVQVNIDNVAFTSGDKGTMSYQHLAKGKYQLDIRDDTGLKGLVPAHGIAQTIEVDKNTHVELPFRTSKIITGMVLIQLDSLSNTAFTPGGIKVTAKDDTGVNFTGLTDEKGAFFINVPAGHYIVSLNPEAFDDKIKPEIMAFSVDLINKNETEIQFIIKQQKRKVRLLNSN